MKMNIEEIFFSIDVSCPECGHTEQISNYDEECKEAVRLMEFECPECSQNSDT